MKLSVIPEPQKTEVKSTEPVFTLTRLVEISAESGCEKGLNSLLSFLENAFELEPVGTGRESVKLKINPDIREKEGYRLTVETDCAVIEGADEEGVFWGVQTFCSLLFQNERALCALEIYDYPLFLKRAFMLDCASWFFTVDAVKLFLDAMAFHKLNVFHWLLTGDAGWRLELFDNYLLSQIGGYRAFTGLGKVPHGGFYSREDTEEILRYARERCITVIPQINVPDKTTAAISAYPQLSCFEKPVSVATDFGDKKTALCLGKESTYDLIFSVLDEVAAVFDGGIIHLGGERVKKVDRSACPHCREKAASLADRNEGALYSYFLDRAKAHLDSLGCKTIIYQGDFKLPDGAIRDCKTDESVKKAKSEGAVMIDSRLDLSRPFKETGIEECYKRNTDESNQPFAVEAVLHTENVTTMKKAGELLFPRLGAFSESVWTGNEKRDYVHFLEKLNDYHRFIAFLRFDYSETGRSALFQKLKSRFFKK